MKKSLFKVLFVWLLVLLSLACSATELDQLIASGVLRVAVKDTERPPFVCRDEKGELVGFEIEFVKRCAELLKVEAQFVICESSNEMVDAVAEGRVDMALGLLSRTYDRILKVNFSNPYVKMRQSLLIHRQKFAILRKDMSLDDYIDEYSGVIHVIPATSHFGLAHYYFPNARIKTASQREICQMIETKELIAFFSDQATIRTFLDRQPGSRVFFQQVIFDDLIDNICVAVPLDCPRFLYWLNCLLEAHEKYFESIMKDSL